MVEIVLTIAPSTGSRQPWFYSKRLYNIPRTVHRERGMRGGMEITSHPSGRKQFFVSVPTSRKGKPTRRPSVWTHSISNQAKARRMRIEVVRGCHASRRERFSQGGRWAAMQRLRKDCAARQLLYVSYRVEVL